MLPIKKFEVPYNFNYSLISFYQKHSPFVRFLYLPPYKEDSINTRTSIETRKKGRCYMPQSREEYECHLRKIVDAGLKFVILWQVPDNVISADMLDYYSSLNTSGFIIANDKNADLIKTYNPELLVIGSLTQRICTKITNKDLQRYDQIVLYYPFNRALDALKALWQIKDKLVIMPNTFCHIECPSTHHWFPRQDRPFKQDRDCPVLTDHNNYIKKCGFISPEHLYLFDPFICGYKLQGREYTTELLKYICQIYFERKSPLELLNAMLGKEISNKLIEYSHNIPLEEYYNTKTQEIMKEK